MVADIASGHVDAADILLLFAVVLAFVAAVVSFAAPAAYDGRRVALGWGALGCVALALLLL